MRNLIATAVDNGDLNMLFLPMFNRLKKLWGELLGGITANFNDVFLGHRFAPWCCLRGIEGVNFHIVIRQI